MKPFTRRESRPALLAATALVAVALALAACRAPTSPSATPASVLITDYKGPFTYTVDVGEGSHDVYFVFTNTSLNTSLVTSPTVSGVRVDGVDLPDMVEQQAGSPDRSSASLRDKIAFDNQTLFSRIHPLWSAAQNVIAPPSGTPVADTVNGTAGLISWGVTGMVSTSSTCRYVGPSIATAQGSRKLNIWVADDCWTPAPTKKHAVDSTMVTALADKFLKDGTNDIYAWVTAILGSEWGNTGYSDLIPFNGEITILLADIEGDNSDNGGVVGYFYSVNNFTNASLAGSPNAGESNERIMFVVDAEMFANPDDNGYAKGTSGYVDNGWQPTDFWAEEVFSTLAHEFQHMIQFYRKGVVVRGDGWTADTWIDEMCSQLVEDLVADKLGVKGPRGIAGTGGAGTAGNGDGRIPIFNQYLSLGLTQTSSYNVNDYSFSYAFGAWLAREYGGAQFVKSVVYDHATDSTAILDAVRTASGRSMTMPGLLQRWAVAVLGSSRLDMPPGFRYNTGGWIGSTEGGITYQLGSIDFFNYTPVPSVITKDGVLKVGLFPKASNLYYLAASGLSGKKSFAVNVPTGVGFSVYVTP
jgi:hypothetical protein